MMKPQVRYHRLYGDWYWYCPEHEEYVQRGGLTFAEAVDLANIHSYLNHRVSEPTC